MVGISLFNFIDVSISLCLLPLMTLNSPMYSMSDYDSRFWPRVLFALLFIRRARKWFAMWFF